LTVKRLTSTKNYATCFIQAQSQSKSYCCDVVKINYKHLSHICAKKNHSLYVRSEKNDIMRLLINKKTDKVVKKN